MGLTYLANNGSTFGVSALYVTKRFSLGIGHSAVVIHGFKTVQWMRSSEAGLTTCRFRSSRREELEI
jgi:hypothetical protein